MVDVNELAGFLIQSNSVRVNNDDELLEVRDKTSLKKHSRNYDSILNEYTSHVEKTLKNKRFMKMFFFWLSISVMILCVIFIICSVLFVIYEYKQNTDFNVQDYIIPVVTAISSFLTVFIIIPKIIAEYLFNSSEDAVMKDIVSIIQDYDKYVRDNLSKSSTDS